MPVAAVSYDADLMDDLKFRSYVEALSVVDKGRRREWTDAEKVRIVEESLRGFRQCAATARLYRPNGLHTALTMDSH